MIGLGVVGAATDRSLWTWSATPCSTFCPTARPRRSPLGCASILGSRPPSFAEPGHATGPAPTRTVRGRVRRVRFRSRTDGICCATSVMLFRPSWTASMPPSGWRPSRSGNRQPRPSSPCPRSHRTAPSQLQRRAGATPPTPGARLDTRMRRGCTRLAPPSRASPSSSVPTARRFGAGCGPAVRRSGATRRGRAFSRLTTTVWNGAGLRDAATQPGSGANSSSLASPAGLGPCGLGQVSGASARFSSRRATPVRTLPSGSHHPFGRSHAC